jgi:hypothetical protein
MDEWPFTTECPYPYNYLNFFDASGKRVKWWKASVLAHYITNEALEKELPLEVIYVGQAYGGDGRRTAIDRLQKHETLQNIYSEAMARSPHMDIWITLWSFTSRLITAIDGRWTQYGTSSDEDDRHSNKC